MVDTIILGYLTVLVFVVIGLIFATHDRHIERIQLAEVTARLDAQRPPPAHDNEPLWLQRLAEFKAEEQGGQQETQPQATVKAPRTAAKQKAGTK